MNIFGKEYGFQLTIGASDAIGKVCRDGDIANMGELLSGGTYSETVSALCVMAIAMNDGYRLNRKIFYDINNDPVLTRDHIMALNPADIDHLIREVTEAINQGMERSVIAESIQGKNDHSEATA